MDEKEFRKRLSKAIEEGKLVVGLDRTLKLLAKGSAETVAVASNCPDAAEIERLSKKRNADFFRFSGSNKELGEVCRKVFRVSSLAMIGKQVSK